STKSEWKELLAAVTLLVFAAAPAGAGVIASDLLPVGAGGHGSLRRTERLAIAARDGLLQRLGPLRGALNRHMVDAGDDPMADRLRELFELPIGLGLVFHQRVALPIGAQVASFAQVIHAGQVADPE